MSCVCPPSRYYRHAESHRNERPGGQPTPDRTVRAASGAGLRAKNWPDGSQVATPRPAVVHHETDTFITTCTAIDPLRSDNATVALELSGARPGKLTGGCASAPMVSVNICKPVDARAQWCVQAWGAVACSTRLS